MVKPKKPIIFKKSKIGKIKFKEDIKKTSEINKKELALLLLPGEKAKNISLNRKEKSVQLGILTYSKIINNYFIKMHKLNRNQKENKIQILHTHIIPSKKKEFGVALPSMSDIISLFETNKLIRHKFEFIAVLNKKKEIVGYTTIKIKSQKNKLNLKAILKNKLNYKKDPKYKLNLYNLLQELGLEIYFTPETGYKLDNNFNYIKQN